MSTLQILISGDYWHDDFRDQFSKIALPVTMVPLERINSAPKLDYHLIVLAQSRRDQISQATVDALRSSMPDVPIVVLLGSWIEGENRSGTPLIGVNPVFWHQWDSRFEKFCIQIHDGVKSDWHLPLTASVSDRVRDYSPDPQFSERLLGNKFLISTEDRTTFESVSDLLKVYQCSSYWAESATEDSVASEFSAICVDGNHASPEFVDRVRNVQSRFNGTPVVAMLNFPRKQDLSALGELGVQEIVSKPYTHDEFVIPLLRAIGNISMPKSQIVPKPAMVLRKDVSQQPEN